MKYQVDVTVFVEADSLDEAWHVAWDYMDRNERASLVFENNLGYDGFEILEDAVTALDIETAEA